MPSSLNPHWRSLRLNPNYANDAPKVCDYAVLPGRLSRRRHGNLREDGHLPRRLAKPIRGQAENGLHVQHSPAAYGRRQ